jgi:16S rRNA (cytidine1402-2'-O)-methyltransferase
VRRTAGESGTARRVSGTGIANGHPKRRSDRSKPERGSPHELVAEQAPSHRDPEVSPEGELAPGLYLVATPIGNLADITLRALAILRGADRIFCEDTRITKRLLAKYGIRTALEPYHDHNAAEVRPVILAALHERRRVALVSDAGTPLVSDPGFKLVEAALAENLTVTAAPGPSAAVAALLLSGLPPDTFLFAGFLPPRQAARTRTLERWAAIDATLIFFESAQRLAETLADMTQVFGDRPAAVARELTKLHEEVRRGRLAQLTGHYLGAGPPRGEIVVVVGRPERQEPDQGQIDARLRSALAELGVRDAAAKLAAETGLPRNQLYRRALAIRDGKE